MAQQVQAPSNPTTTSAVPSTGTSQTVQTATRSTSPAQAKARPAQPRSSTQVGMTQIKARPVAQNVSIVDYLNSKGQGSSFSDRSRLADSLGIRNYTGSASQNLDLLAMLQNRPRAISDLKANLVHTPNITSPSEADLASMQSKRVPTTIAINRKGGLIKKAQKGTKTKEEYIGNHET